MPPVARAGLAAAQKLLPGHRPAAAARGGFGRARQGVQRRVDLRRIRLPAQAALGEEVDRPEHSPDARIGGQGAEKGLGGDQMVGEVLHLGDGQKEEAVALKIGIGVGLAHEAKMLRLVRQGARQRGGGVGGKVGRPAVDHGEEQVVILRKLPVEVRGGLLPGEIGVHQLAGVAVDAGMAGDIISRPHEQGQGERRHERRPAAAKIYQAADHRAVGCKGRA